MAMSAPKVCSLPPTLTIAPSKPLQTISPRAAALVGKTFDVTKAFDEAVGLCEKTKKRLLWQADQNVEQFRLTLPLAADARSVAE